MFLLPVKEEEGVSNLLRFFAARLRSFSLRPALCSPIYLSLDCAVRAREPWKWLTHSHRVEREEDSCKALFSSFAECVCVHVWLMPFSPAVESGVSAMKKNIGETSLFCRLHRNCPGYLPFFVMGPLLQAV